MNRIVLARRGVLTGAALISGCLLVAACAGGASSNEASSASTRGLVGHGPALSNQATTGSAGFGAAAAEGAPSVAGGKSAVQTADLAPANQSIIYTASLTVRAANVSAAAKRAIGIVVAAGGYIADEQASSAAPGRTGRTITITLKVPVSVYQQVLAQLSSSAIGKQLTMQQQATDVTAQVADVSSLVTSEQDAIAALQALLKHAASVSGLLQVQRQISTDESALNSLLAQQRALNHETTYGTVSMTLLSRRLAAPHHKKPPARRGFLAGLAAGWRALRHATAWVLTALGAALPFLIVVAALAGIGYAGRRRFIRHRSGPAPAGPTAAD
ncbi:MAG TPA: DUF4349 domain-containing protein [Streptosporangiaceae bacterium]|nr:DUF4349 domain-containing protein [Streptosporangiaceae bacterium]